MIQEISLSTTKKVELVDITSKIECVIQESKVKSGICIVYCPHTTGAITINENADPDVNSDIIKKLSSLIPSDDGYDHSEGNSDAHIKSSMIGNEKSIIIDKNSLVLGTWQGVMFFEGDGPRKRKVFVKIMED